MPEELMIVIVMAIIMSAVTVMTVAKVIVGYLKSKDEARLRASAPKGGVTTSELEAVMRRAVTEATQPLLARIDELEDRLDDAGRLPEPARRLGEPERP